MNKRLLLGVWLGVILTMAGCVANNAPQSVSSVTSAGVISSEGKSSVVSSLTSAVSSLAPSSSSVVVVRSSLAVVSSSSAPFVLPADQCNAKAQCQAIFGSVATDCKDSASANSVCLCGSTSCLSQFPNGPANSSATSVSSIGMSSSSVRSSSSVSSVAPVQNAKVMYLDLCSGCHGVNGDDGFAKLHNDTLTAEQMQNAITVDMPPANPALCGQECAAQLTAYIKDVLLSGQVVEMRKPLVARLTQAQVINSVEDIFALVLSSEVRSAIPNESIDEKSFSTLADNQRMESQHPRAYSLLAADVLKQLNVTAFAQQLAGCSGTGATCRTNFAKALGLQLFRRPLTAAEQDHYSQLFATVAALSGAAFKDAAGAVIAAMLQAPQFVYRTEQELGQDEGQRNLNGYELASRLSYFLWQSAPDSALMSFAAANNNGAINATALAGQIDRMMQDPRFARARTTFWADYTITSTAPLLEASTSLANDLKNSLMATLERASGVGATPTPLQDLFGSQQMMLTDQLARNLGLASKGAGMQLYNTSSIPERTGFLAHPGFMANIGSTSFVGRGVVLTERVLCRDIPEPPSGIQSLIDDTADQTRSLTPRQAKDYRFGLGGQCTACHRNFEPIAFAFERFDVLGRYTPKDTLGRDLFTYGYLQTATGGEGPAYDDVAGLMSLLEASDETSACFVQNMQVFAVGRSHMTADKPSIEAAHTQYLSAGGTFDALVRSVALSPAFRQTNTVAN